MTRKANPGKANPQKPSLLLMAAVAIALVLLLLRMVVFVAGHVHHGL